jgi:hypothetical protein
MTDDTPYFFSHAPLTDPKDCIRLIELLPGLPLRRKLSVARLSDAPRYDAVSYSWGSSYAYEIIEVNGHKLAISPNLWNLLVHINDQGQRLPLWCDALCIDQTIEATQERNHQVQLMGRIYSAAQSVLVWLGEEADNSAALFDFLNRSTAAGATQRSQTSNQIDNRTFWTSFKRLCQREYWKRVWIVQEVILARKIEILCGDRRMPWEKLESACLKSEKMPSIRSAASKVCRKSINTSNFGLFIRQRASKQRKSLQELVRVYANSESTNARDAIYGLIGLACAGHELNYSAGVETIYAEVMELCTKEDPSFSILLQERLGGRKRFVTDNIGRGTFAVEKEIFKIRPFSFSFLSSNYHKWFEVSKASCVHLAVQNTLNCIHSWRSRWPMTFAVAIMICGQISPERILVKYRPGASIWRTADSVVILKACIYEEGHFF